MRIKRISIGVAAVLLAVANTLFGAAPTAREPSTVPILVYHRFAPVSNDAMTVATPVFEEQLAWLRAHHYRIIPLRALVRGLREPTQTLPSRAVSITVDDGNESAYRELLPLVRRYRFPVTLFIYPSAISNAGYALTWSQLADMQRTRLVDVQSHTWWHPNFAHERARLASGAYRAFAMRQFVHSKDLIHRHLGGTIDMLAWPYGIHDSELQRWASEAGYVSAFTLVRRGAGPGDDLLALPRYIVTGGDRGARFAALVEGGADRAGEP